MHGTDAVLEKKVDSFGCTASRLDDDRHIAGGAIDYFLKSARHAPPGRVVTPASDRGFVVGVSLKRGHRRMIFHEHHVSSHDFEENSVYVRGFSEDYEAELQGSFGFILMELSTKALASLCEAADVAQLQALETITGVFDPVVSGMARSLFAAAEFQSQLNPLFIEQMTTAIGVRLIDQYSPRRVAALDGQATLSKEQERRAKELLASQLEDGRVSMDALTASCGLPGMAFLRAFQNTTGMSPAEWQERYRLERACLLLCKSALTVDEISLACGFSDKMRFTKAFLEATGTWPVEWQRIIRA